MRASGRPGGELRFRRNLAETSRVAARSAAPAPEFPSNDEQKPRWLQIFLQIVFWTILLLTPRGLSPRVTRLWIRLVVWTQIVVLAALVAVFVASGVLLPLMPHRLGGLKWLGVIYFGVMGWAAVRFFPQVWQNRSDDKVAVVFAAILVLLPALILWDVLAR